MKGSAVVLFPAHPTNCEVCQGKARVGWCAVRPGPDGDMVADKLGTPMPCIPLPQWDVPAPEFPSGGDAA